MINHYEPIFYLLMYICSIGENPGENPDELQVKSNGKMGNSDGPYTCSPL